MCDWDGSRIVICNLHGDVLGSWGSAGSGPGHLNRPWACATDGKYIYISDQDNYRIVVLESEGRLHTHGRFVRAFGKQGNGDGQFNTPRGVTVHGEELWVADRDNYRIQIFEKSTGNFLRKFGLMGSEQEGRFNYPYCIAFDSGDNALIADGQNRRIQIVRPNGQFVTSFGTTGTRDGEFSNVFSLCVAQDGTIFVGDFAQHVQAFGFAMN